MNAQNKIRKEGSALFTVLVVIFTLAGVMGTIVSIGQQRAFMAKKLADKARAISIAEAGANYAYTVLVTNFAQRSNPAAFPPTSYGGGSYDVTVLPVGDKKAIVYSTGACGYAEVAVIVDVHNYGEGGAGGRSWDEDDFAYAILAGGNFAFGGSGDISGTNGSPKLHSNGDLDINGSVSGSNISIEATGEIDVGNLTINADLTAETLDIHKNATINGATNEAIVEPVTPPDINLTPYYNWAAANGEVYTPTSGVFEINSATNITGGILWVDGDVQISGNNYTFNGSIFATGDIIVAGGGGITFNKDETGFALCSRDGDIQVSASATINGLIYAKTGSYRQTANGTVEGLIITAGDVSKGGVSDVLVYEKIIPTPPGGAEWSDMADLVGVSAWQQ